MGPHTIAIIELRSYRTLLVLADRLRERGITAGDASYHFSMHHCLLVDFVLGNRSPMTFETKQGEIVSFNRFTSFF